MPVGKTLIKMVALKEPCTACVITGGLLKETLEKLVKEYEDVKVEIVELDHIRQASGIDGLEVERFPALLVNGIQVTAGSLLSKQQLSLLIKQGDEDSEQKSEPCYSWRLSWSR